MFLNILIMLIVPSQWQLLRACRDKGKSGHLASKLLILKLSAGVFGNPPSLLGPLAIASGASRGCRLTEERLRRRTVLAGVRWQSAVVPFVDREGRFDDGLFHQVESHGDIQRIPKRTHHHTVPVPRRPLVSSQTS
ncbi:hypothetical protein D9M69_472570 [compost metagenome]